MWYRTIPSCFPPLADPPDLSPPSPVGKTPLPVAGPYEAVPALSRPGERAEPAPRQPRRRSRATSGAFEGQRQDRKAIAERVATYGLRVFCTDCGLMHRHRTNGGDRLRNIPSGCCGARMRLAKWVGWDAWRHAARDSRREEPEPMIGYVVRQHGKYYMRGFDS